MKKPGKSGYEEERPAALRTLGLYTAGDPGTDDLLEQGGGQIFKHRKDKP